MPMPQKPIALPRSCGGNASSSTACESGCIAPPVAPCSSRNATSEGRFGARPQRNEEIVKPATETPLSALKLTETLLEAGLPPEGIQCLTGPGGEIGDLLAADSRVRKITFTGSRDVGERSCRTTGIKKVTMELGSNAPVIVMPDADLDKVAAAVAATGFANAGQVCISAQRVLAAGQVYGDFLDVLKPKVEAITAGDQLDTAVKMGPMVREKDAARVRSRLCDPCTVATATSVEALSRGLGHDYTDLRSGDRSVSGLRHR